MNFLIQNLTKNSEVEKSLDQYIIEGKTTGVGKELSISAIKSGSSYLLESDSITDYQILTDFIKSLKKEYNLYIKNLDFPGKLKIFTLTNFYLKKSDKTSEKVEVTEEVIKDISSSMKKNIKVKMKRLTLNQFLNEYKGTDVTILNKLNKLFTKVKVGEETVLVQLPNDCHLIIKGDKYWTNTESLKSEIEKEDLTYDDSLNQ